MRKKLDYIPVIPEDRKDKGLELILWHDGSRSWHKDGKRHRMDGPAWKSSRYITKLWFINGIECRKAWFLKHPEKITKMKAWELFTPEELVRLK